MALACSFQVLAAEMKQFSGRAIEYAPDQPMKISAGHRRIKGTQQPQASALASGRTWTRWSSLMLRKTSRRQSVALAAAAAEWSAYPFSKRDARLVLEDGSVWLGCAFGATGTALGEVVFNTSLTGYQEIITDPSYYGQLVVFTCPHIGNVGANTGILRIDTDSTFMIVTTRTL